MSIQLRDGFLGKTLDHVLEDLLVRFLVNAPNEDLSSSERVLFLVEEAQWFYTDFLRQQYPGLPPMKMKNFCTKILEKCPLIWKWGDASQALSKFGKYKSSIPVRGIALFNSDLTKVVLVKGFESNSWSFPRGKISKDEGDLECAVREVEEETGFNARHLINENDVIDRTIKGKNYKIYLVKDVPEDYDFKPLVRNEIAAIEWFDVKGLQKKIRLNPNHYFIVSAVIKAMMNWISKSKGTINEAELKLEAEIKLKELMGIGKLQTPDIPIIENDAGRELLDILQGAGVSQTPVDEESTEDNNESDSTPNDPDPVTVSIPQSMAAPYAHLMDSSITDSQNSVFESLPFLRNYQAKTPKMDNSINTPSPESLNNPSKSFMNPKELLSILNSGSGSKQKDNLSEELKRNEDLAKNKGKAQELLKLFQKEGSSPVPESKATQTVLTSNDLEKSLQEPYNEEKQSNPGKVKILKKGEGKDLLDLLKRGNNKESSESPGSPSTSANSLLNLLKKPTVASPDTSREFYTPEPEPQVRPEPASNPSHELLGMLKKPRESQTPVQQTSAQESPVPQASTQPSINHQHSSDLLGLLRKDPYKTPEPDYPREASTVPPNVESSSSFPVDQPPEEEPVDENFEDFENFDDFEDFDALDNEIKETTQDQSEENEDDDDDQFHDTNDHVSDTNGAHLTAEIPVNTSTEPLASIASVASSVNTTPVPAYQQYQSEVVNDNQRQGPVKGSFRLLKPGQSINEIEQPKVDHQSGNALLSLLHRSSSAVGNQSTGLPSPTLNTSPNPVSPPAATGRTNSLLDLLNGLGKRNNGTSSPASQTAPSPGPQKSHAANDLLSLLQK